MKEYTAQEWQIKFKKQAGNDKQLLHNLECTGLVKSEEAESELHKLRLQLNDCESFLDMLWMDAELSKLFRIDLAKIRCKLCGIMDCSVRDDREECLRIIETVASNKPNPMQKQEIKE
jgi:hypothetical protein